MNSTLYYKKKAKLWEEALPVGNGRIGGMVFGNLKAERIALNEDTLWSGYPKDLSKKDAHQYLEPLRNAIFNEDHKEANKIANKDFYGFFSECYLPFGDLYIEYSKTSKMGYKRTLDISKGISVTQNKDLTQTVFVSHPAQLMVVNIKSTKPISFKVKLSSQLKHTCKTIEDTLVMLGDAPEICMPVYYKHGETFNYGSGAMKFAGAVKVLGNAEFEEDYISVKNQTEATILISLATNFIDYKSMPAGDPLEKAMAYFENIKSYDVLLKDHIADFSRLYNRVDVDFGSERANVPTNKRLKDFQKGADDNNLMALLFQYGRYLTISCSRPGTRAMNLQGIFNPHIKAPWSSNYTVNINTQMNYWCTDICNLSECFEPFFEQVKNMCINGQDIAKDYYNCNGSCAHHNSDIWAECRPASDPLGIDNAESYAFWNSSLPWMLNQVFEHYRYVKDEKLFEEMKPYFKMVLDFYKDYLVEKDGMLVTCPSISPENTFLNNGQRACLTYLPTMDIGILEEFFQNCREFGFDTPQMPPIPIGSDGRINEWVKEYKETEVEHRHVSHLYCVYPSAVPQSNEVKEACKKSLLTRGFLGTGWALGWKICLWARLGDADKTLKLIKNQLRPIKAKGINYSKGGGSYYNLFDAHPPFQIDGNFGVSAGIAELLVSENIPKTFTGYAKGLKRKDGTELNIKFEKGVIK